MSSFKYQSIPIICLAGPTGSGKTSIAIQIAKNLNAEIINADSRQIYADFPIITAIPSEAERGGIPHHLYGYLKIVERTTAAQWAKLAEEKAVEVFERGRVPLFVGGTGFYFHVLLQGLSHIPEVDRDITAIYAKRMQNEGVSALYEELKVIDPEYALKIHPHDRQRVSRALEVYATSGKPFSWWHRLPPARPLCTGKLYVLDVTLADLAPKLRSRIDAMIEAGALKETKLAWEKCPYESAPVWSGIGCRECLYLLQKKIDKDSCISQWYANTRAYAKRQITWFHSRPEAIWVKPEQAVEVIQATNKCYACS